MSQRIWATLALAGFGSALAVAGTIERKFPDSKLKVRYSTNDQGDRDGTYEEYHHNGKLKIKAFYKADRLDGPFKRYHENGRPHVSAAYKGGQLTGTYTEDSEQGLRLLSSTYKDGKLDGPLTRYEKGKPAFTQTYRDGVPAHARSLGEIKKKLAEILQAPPPAGEVDLALCRLKAYRYLMELPYENLVLDEQLNREAQAAARICEKIGRLDHNPKNPGWPEADYKLALAGCQCSNLAGGTNITTIGQSVDLWMNDTLGDGKGGLGHRRWCLNPALRRVGFGKAGEYVAMWTKDQSQTRIPDFDFMCYPARGLMPVEFFGPEHAWHVSLHSTKYAAPDKSVTTTVYAVDQLWTRRGEPIQLDFSMVDTTRYGLPNCIIFRPTKGSVEPGKRYQVQIEGLKRLDGKTPAPLSYIVEFVSLP